MAKGIMLQGTSSNVGKSIVATGLCRVFAQDGYRVAPFKAWNMGLNSYVTEDGGEIGRGQGVQAEGAGVQARVEMQPILVKPKGNGRSQIIVKGKVLGDFGLERKKEDYLKLALGIINESLKELAEDFEVLVLEGAGSPAEINIKDKDLANMKVAKLNNTPVILVADIDRGGALAAVVGTLKLLEPEERSLVKGIILNKFRGDYDLLKPGIDILEERTGKPVLGVIPFLREFKLPDEDGASLKDYNGEGEIRIGVIDLPHISNSTDFDPLSYEKGVEVIYSIDKDELGECDGVIIPGTKNTIADLIYLKEKGLDKYLIDLARRDKVIFGICGGYQILGKKLLDPSLSEGQSKDLEGLCLLDIETTFNYEKMVTQSEGKIELSRGIFSELEGEVVKGFEIHSGQSELGEEAISWLRKAEISSFKEEVLGASNLEGRVIGTYLHDIFNNDRLRRGFINYLRRNKGLDELEEELIMAQSKLEESYHMLAQSLRDNLDMDSIYNIIEGGVIDGRG